MPKKLKSLRAPASFLLLLVMITLSSCKHDYPSTTPKWLRQKIKEFKRTGKSGGIEACYDGAVRIEECRENTTGATLYRIVVTDPTFYFYYDHDGNYLTTIYAMQCSAGNIAGCPVGSYNTNNIVFIQLVWTPKHCN